MKLLCMSPLAKRCLLYVLDYTRLSGDEITLTLENYNIMYEGDVTEERVNELRMYCLGVYDVLRTIG